MSNLNKMIFSFISLWMKLFCVCTSDKVYYWEGGRKSAKERKRNNQVEKKPRVNKFAGKQKQNLNIFFLIF